MKMGALVLGYHGCDQKVAEALLSGEDFKVSKNGYDWLGDGVYFWENNPERALAWARFMAKHPKFSKRIKQPHAIGAVIDLGNCLDLTESTSLGLVKGAYNHLKSIFADLDAPLPENRAVSNQDNDLLNRSLDCAVINALHEFRELTHDKSRDGNETLKPHKSHESFEPFSTVRGAFHEGEPLYPGARIMAKTHIQVCVRNTKLIKGVFRIKEIENI